MHQGIIYRIMKTEILRAGYPNALKHAVDVLQHGGLVAFPTDTVYGLAALPFNDEYVEGLSSILTRLQNAWHTGFGPVHSPWW
jgi:tRNA A37 threonylcarbamoyladenosine synthetase subunit TsaC/SUA5/YrdC